MRPTFMGFETARKGLYVSQKWLDVTGHNLTNIATPGYTRQRLDQVAVSPNVTSTRYATLRTDFAGQGVEAKGVSQVRDSFLDRRFREEYGDLGYYDKRNNMLEDIEAALDEYDTNTGVGKAIETLYKALENFSSNANSKTHANIVMTAFKSIGQTLQQVDTKLNNALEQEKYDLELSVKDVNSALERLAYLNKQISDDITLNSALTGEYYGPNELMDERNLILDELSRYGDTEVIEQSDGSVTVNFAGHTVLKGDDFETLTYSRNNDGTVSVRWNSTNQPVNFLNGSLKASLDIINGRGGTMVSPNETTERGFLYYQDKLNSFASTFASVMNNIIPEQGPDGEPLKDADGNIVYKELVGARVPEIGPDGKETGKFIFTAKNARVTASNIAINDKWTLDATYIMFDPDSKESKYVTALLTALKNDTHSFTAPNGNSFSGTFAEFVQDYATSTGTEKAYAQGRLDACAAVCDDLLNRRDGVSGVSRDEEASNLMMFQKSYQAAARLMTTLDEALDVVVNKMGLVGR